MGVRVISTCDNSLGSVNPGPTVFAGSAFGIHVFCGNMSRENEIIFTSIDIIN